MQMTFVTGNQNKFVAAKQIIPELEMHDLDLVEIQAVDSQKIIEHKLTEAKKNIAGSIVVEDTSLTFSCLGALPGPLIKWFMNELGNDKIYQICKSFNNFDAEAKVTIGYSDKNDQISFFESTVMGKIVPPRGNNGFGWDPIFQPDGFAKTYAELTLEEKNQISMRRLAFQKLADFLKK